MATTTKTLNEIKANFSEVTQNIIDGMDLYDYNHQCADSDQSVIYYGLARDKYNNATSEQQEHAEDQYNEYGFEFKGVDDLMTKLAYFIVLEEYREQHEQEIKDDIEALEEFIETVDIGSDFDDAYDIIATLSELV